MIYKNINKKIFSDFYQIKLYIIFIIKEMAQIKYFIKLILIIQIYATFSKENNDSNIISKKNIFDELKLLKYKKKNKKIIEICNEVISKDDLDTSTKVKILEILGEAYINNKEYKKAIEIYKNIINNYQDLYNKDNVLYNICLSIYTIMPKRPEVDISNCKEMISYGKYSLQNIDSDDIKKKINQMIDEAHWLIETKELNDIKFFYDNKKYNSALHLIDVFINTFNNSQYYNNLINIKCLSHCNQIKEYLKIIKTIKNKKKSNNSEFYSEIYNKIFDNYNQLKKIYEDLNISNETRDNIKKNMDEIILYISKKN